VSACSAYGIGYEPPESGLRELANETGITGSILDSKIQTVPSVAVITPLNRSAIDIERMALHPEECAADRDSEEVSVMGSSIDRVKKMSC
jgi:hypothetical protein